MSKETTFHLKDKIDSTAGLALVDTSELSDSKFETMIFRIKRGSVDYSRELDCVITYNEIDARKAHQTMIKKWAS